MFIIISRPIHIYEAIHRDQFVVEYILIAELYLSQKAIYYGRVYSKTIY